MSTIGVDAMRSFAPDMRQVSSTALHDAPGKVVDSVSARPDQAVVVTRYRDPQAYFLSANLAERLAVKAAGLDAFRRDLEAVRPFLRAAMLAGVSTLDALDLVLKESDEGTVVVDFVGLGQLMSRVPVPYVADEDGSDVARVGLPGVQGSGNGIDDHE